MSRRVERVGEAMRDAIAELLTREIKDPRIGMVTLIGVDVSPDLRHARIHFSCIGDQEARRRSLAGLQSAAGFIRGQLTRRLRLRYAPELTFIPDTTVEEADRLASILKDVVPDEK
jgi:ribosome-binding factor A